MLEGGCNYHMEQCVLVFLQPLHIDFMSVCMPVCLTYIFLSRNWSCVQRLATKYSGILKSLGTLGFSGYLALKTPTTIALQSASITSARNWDTRISLSLSPSPLLSASHFLFLTLTLALTLTHCFTHTHTHTLTLTCTDLH